MNTLAFRATILATLWVFSVLPLLMVFYVAGWIWCCAEDGFLLARMTYDEYKEGFKDL